MGIQSYRRNPVHMIFFSCDINTLLLASCEVSIRKNTQVRISALEAVSFWRLNPLMPQAREMTHHGGTPGWLEESDPAGWDLCCDGRSMPPFFWRTMPLSQTNRAAVTDVLVLKYTKYRHELYHARKAWVNTLVRPRAVSVAEPPHFCCVCSLILPGFC